MVLTTGRRLAARLQARDAPPDLRPQAPELTERIVDQMVATLPVFRNSPVDFHDVVRIVVRRIVDQVLLLFLELRLPTRQEVRALVEVCVPPTDQGVTLEDMLVVFRIAQDVLWNELDRLIESEELADPRMALELSHLGVSLISELSTGATAEYLRGDRVWLQRRDAERALVRGILGAPSRVEDATRAATSLDLQVFDTWRCAVYEPLEGTRIDDLAARLTDARVTWGLRGAIDVLDDAVVLVTQGDPALSPPSGSRCGIGGVHDGAQGMRTSHDEARDALAVARRRGVESLDVASARLGRVVLGSLSASALADDVLAPIDAQPPGRRALLLETLEALLDHQGSATAAADDLQLHVQSVRYRFRQLGEVLGGALDDPEQRLQLHLGVKARRLGAG
jgi:hypothetical protein